MRRLPTLFLALLLAAAPLMAEAGLHVHDHGGVAGHAAAGHSSAGHDRDGADAMSASADEDCEDGMPDHCCGDTGVTCTATYLFSGLPADAGPMAVSASNLLGRGHNPDTRHPESDPPPPRA